MSVSIPITTDLGGVITYPHHHHYCGPLSKALNPWTLLSALHHGCQNMLTHVVFSCYKFPFHFSVWSRNRRWLLKPSDRNRVNRTAVCYKQRCHRYAHEKSNLFKHDSIRSQSRVSFSSSGKYHRSRIKNEKFKNYFWSFPTRLENLKPNLREDFHNLKNKTKKKRYPNASSANVLMAPGLIKKRALK